MPNFGISLEKWCNLNNCLNLLSYLENKDDRYISYASHTKIGWVCNLGHSFKIDPCKFTNPSRCRGNLGLFSCPYCSGQKVLVGFNDLATTRPDLASEWDYSKNSFLPTQVTKGSHKDVWWYCNEGHSWKARISARDYKNGCPYCSNISKTSLPEQVLYYYIKKYYPEALNMYSINGVSYDIYIPSLKMVIEYDGSHWHSNKDTNYKFKFAKDNGLTLYKITGVFKDRNLPDTFYLDDTNLNLTSLDNNLVLVLKVFLNNVFSIKETFSDYKEAYNFACNQKLQSKRDTIALPDNIEFEWSPLNPFSFNYCQNDNNDKLWRCFRGHTFSRRLDVIRRGYTACPYCHNRAFFSYLYLGTFNSLYLILDRFNLELELVDEKTVFKAIDEGINIQGITTRNNELVFSLDYIINMKPTAFRKNFECYKGVVFKAYNNCSTLAIRLTNIFSTNTSAEAIHKKLNKFLNESEE